LAILAFDVYGTILDLDSMEIDRDLLRDWRTEQLGMTWRATLMGLWLDFDELTRISLRYVLRKRGLDLGEEEILRRWEGLRAYEDSSYICALAERHSIYALTNGTRRSIERALERNGLLGCFEGIYTAESVRRYKPSAEIYRGFLAWVGSSTGYLVSSNPFDIAGARNAGMDAIYVNRHRLPEDPLAPPPSYVVSNIGEILGLPI